MFGILIGGVTRGVMGEDVGSGGGRKSCARPRAAETTSMLEEVPAGS